MQCNIASELTPDSFAWEQWEALVKSHTECGVMQSLPWAEFKRAQRLETLHVMLHEGSELVGGALFYHVRNANGAGILIAPEGPVLPWATRGQATEGLRLLMDEAGRYARDRGIMAMRIEPRIAMPMPPLLREFGRAPVDLIPRETLYVDLGQTEQEILARMKPKGRYNIRLAERHGVNVKEDVGRQAVERFYPVMQEASRRDDFALEQLQFFKELAGALCPSGIARFLFAEHEGEILGTLLLLTYGSRATYLYGGISNKKRNLMGGYALQWAAMKLAKQSGCSTYDFYGFDQFGSPLHAYARFSRFKRQFGGEVVRLIGAHDHFFLDSLADAFIKAVNETALAGAPA